MTDLADMRFEELGKDSQPATPTQRTEYMHQIPEWQLVEQDGIQRLERAYACRDFTAALEFANQVGTLAEKINHHPTLLVAWGSVTVHWWTHVVGGLHPNDFIAAARTDRLSTS